MFLKMFYSTFQSSSTYGYAQVAKNFHTLSETSFMCGLTPAAKNLGCVWGTAVLGWSRIVCNKQGVPKIMS